MRSASMKKVWAVIRAGLWWEGSPYRGTTVYNKHYLHAVHGFEQLSYTTPESDSLQGINFRPNVKGIGQPANIGVLSGTIVLEEDTASKFISHQTLFIEIIIYSPQCCQTFQILDQCRYHRRLMKL